MRTSNCWGIYWLLMLMSWGIVRAPRLQAEPTALGPVVVVSGGFDSCGWDDQGYSPFTSGPATKATPMINDIFTKLKQPEQHGLLPDAAATGMRWLYSCFDAGGNIYFQSSRSDVRQTTTPASIGVVIAELVALSDNMQRPIVVTGHSHGGWLAMKITASLPQNMRVDLFTNDPISFAECQPSTFARAMAVTAVVGIPGLEWLTPCKRFPADIMRGTASAIRARQHYVTWKNYYQENFWPLHSGQPEGRGGPDFNLDMSPFLSKLYGGVAASWIAHLDVAKLSGFWYPVELRILSYFKTPEAESESSGIAE